MFYCRECQFKEGWPQSLTMGYGQCEICRRARQCFDAPSWWLSPSSPASYVGFADRSPTPNGDTQIRCSEHGQLAITFGLNPHELSRLWDEHERAHHPGRHGFFEIKERGPYEEFPETS